MINPDEMAALGGEDGRSGFEVQANQNGHRVVKSAFA